MSTTAEPLDVADLIFEGSPLSLEQYCGLWALEESFFHRQWALFKEMDLAAHVRQSSPRTAATTSRSDGGVEVIEIRGMMTKHGSSLSDAGSTVRIRQAVRAARNDPAVRAVMFVIDSPGGTVAGTGDLADEIAKLSAEKPTMTFAEDLMASAALYVGTQSRKVYANSPNAVVGSMGVFIGLYDLSGMAMKEGIKPVVIKTGELKGAGFPGAEITDAQKAMWQGLAAASFHQFSAAVQRQRSLSPEQLKEITRAGVYPAKQAIDLGLIDGIRTYDAAVAELRSMIIGSTATASTPKQEHIAVSHPTIHAIVPVRSQAVSAVETWNSAIAELKASGKNESEAVQHVTRTRPDLHRAFLAESNNRPVPAFAMAVGSATQRWDAAIASLVAQGNSRQVATGELIRTNPGLHSEFLAEANKR